MKAGDAKLQGLMAKHSPMAASCQVDYPLCVMCGKFIVLAASVSLAAFCFQQLGNFTRQTVIEAQYEQSKVSRPHYSDIASPDGGCIRTMDVASQHTNSCKDS